MLDYLRKWVLHREENGVRVVLHIQYCVYWFLVLLRKTFSLIKLLFKGVVDIQKRKNDIRIDLISNSS